MWAFFMLHSLPLDFQAFPCVTGWSVHHALQHGQLNRCCGATERRRQHPDMPTIHGESRLRPSMGQPSPFETALEFFRPAIIRVGKTGRGPRMSDKRIESSASAYFVRPTVRIGLCRAEVAIGVSVNSVDLMVKEGILPRPRKSRALMGRPSDHLISVSSASIVPDGANSQKAAAATCSPTMSISVDRNGSFRVLCRSIC